VTDLTVLKRPGAIDDFYKHVANGGSPIDLAVMWKIPFSELMHWIHTSPTHKQLYDDALQAQAEWAVRRVLQEVKRIGFADIRDAYQEDGRLKDIKDMPVEVAAVIASVESVDYFEGRGKEKERVGVIQKVKFWNKLDAIKMLATNLGMLVERVEHSGKVSLESLINASLQVKKEETITIVKAESAPAAIEATAITEDDI
jgi:hypothetical protein